MIFVNNYNLKKKQPMIIEDKLELCERTLDNRHFAKVVNKDAQSSISLVRSLLDKDTKCYETLATYMLLGILQSSTRDFNEKSTHDNEADIWLEETIGKFINILYL